MKKLKDFIVNLWQSFRDSGCLGWLIFVVIGLALFHSCSKEEEKKYDRVYESAYEEGYNDGFKDGEDFGYEKGYEDGNNK
jgi:hypothetical protein